MAIYDAEFPACAGCDTAIVNKQYCEKCVVKIQQEVEIHRARVEQLTTEINHLYAKIGRVMLDHIDEILSNESEE
jgi:hypothetical protein